MRKLPSTAKYLIRMIVLIGMIVLIRMIVIESAVVGSVTIRR